MAKDERWNGLLLFAVEIRASASLLSVVPAISNDAISHSAALEPLVRVRLTAPKLSSGNFTALLRNRLKRLIDEHGQFQNRDASRETPAY